MATKTRFDELRFHQPFPGVWRFVDAEDRDVGPQYATRAELLADLERYAAEYGCVGAVDVNATLRARVAELEEGRAQERIAHEATIRDCQSLRDRLRVAEKDAAEYLDGREMYRRDLGRANAEIARLREALETIRAGLADDRAYRDTARAALNH